MLCALPDSAAAEGGAAASAVAKRGGFLGTGDPPRIAPPAPLRRKPVAVNPGALPPGARAQLPALDGDPFFVALPVRVAAEVTEPQLQSQVVAPILAAIGFDLGPQALSRPPLHGVAMPVASFAGLAQEVAFEYASNPGLLRPRTKAMLAAFLDPKLADTEIDRALGMGEGMNFAQFVRGIERRETLFPYQQHHGGVPIEHAGLVAARWEEQAVTAVRGALIRRYRIANRVGLDPTAAIPAARAALAAVPGIDRVVSAAPESGPVLVLLPYGTNRGGKARLRYAYRMTLRAASGGQDGSFLLWLDARRPRILALDPLFGEFEATGACWNRNPGVGVTSCSFEVDPPEGGVFTLKLAGFMERLDFEDDGFDALDVSIADDGSGVANFDVDPINDGAEAVCDAGVNKAFQQVHVFATAHRYWRSVLARGIFEPYPTVPFSPTVEDPGEGCNAHSSMHFGACDGYYDPACPDATDGGAGDINRLNTVQENTIIGHELGHTVTARLTEGRPADWCGAAACAIPQGFGLFHDLCEAWASHLESTDCAGGWFAKNVGGVDNSLDCANHDEGGGGPRLLRVTVPLDPADPLDHFPEHRALAAAGTGGRADGQVAGAALWQVRAGMRSKCRPSGLPQYGVRYQRALRDTGFLPFAAGDSDLAIYERLHDLEVQLAYQWATAGAPGGPPAFAHNGPHTTNKVTGGFARAGLFLIPYHCLDGVAEAADAGCSDAGTDWGGDAVVDVDDNDPADDFLVSGVTHSEVDFLELGGPAPTFHVWTGPRYRLDGALGASTLDDPAPCNTKFKVEVSNDPAFPAGDTVESAWLDVDLEPSTPASPECYGTWSPDAAQWADLQAGGDRLHYRATTRDAADGNERGSTLPGNGLWDVPAPYAVITADGMSDY